MKKLLTLTAIATVMAGLTGCSNCCPSLGLGCCNPFARREVARPLICPPQMNMSCPCPTPCASPSPCASPCANAPLPYQPGCSSCGGGTGGAVMSSGPVMTNAQVISEGFSPEPLMVGPGE